MANDPLKKKFPHRNIYSSIHAYGIFKHRHTSEIDQEFSEDHEPAVYTASIHVDKSTHAVNDSEAPAVYGQEYSPTCV